VRVRVRARVSHLELRQLLHELLLLLAVAERRQDVEEDLEEVQVLTRDAGQGEDGRDAADTRERERERERGTHGNVSMRATQRPRANTENRNMTPRTGTSGVLTFCVEASSHNLS